MIQIDGAANDKVLTLPLPATAEAFLTSAAVSAQGSNELVSLQHSEALAVAINEDVGLGAISKVRKYRFRNSFQHKCMIKNTLFRLVLYRWVRMVNGLNLLKIS